MEIFKTCNGGGFCNYSRQDGSQITCTYEGCCDYQRPKNSKTNTVVADGTQDMKREE